jgi:hypothetical protein
MSKRPKKKQPKPTALKRGLRSAPAGFVGLVMVMTLGFGWWHFRNANISPAAKPVAEVNAANPAALKGKTEFQQLRGQWLRPDGGYILAIRNVADSGAIEVSYFNPSPIHVAKAEASREGAFTTVFIELRDVNYPGSTYTLTYEPVSDQLRGIYYQAVEQQRFQVVFERMR